jgi:carbamoyl-phosphate synthase large subunit
MKSTGEVMGLDKNLDAALYKAFIAAGYRVYSSGKVLLDVPVNEMGKWQGVTDALQALGFELTVLSKDADGSRLEEVKQDIKQKKYQYVISTNSYSYHIRRAAVENRVDCLTAMDTITALLRSVAFLRNNPVISVRPLQDYVLYKCC